MNAHLEVSGQSLPKGVVIRRLAVNSDARGSLTEIYRHEWQLGCDAVQFNYVLSTENTLRGVHVHVKHSDHIVVAGGEMLLGLHDMRLGSDTLGQSCMLRLRGAEPTAAMVPPGVAHGFYFPEQATLIYATSTYWSASDELGCRWDCPEFNFSWPTKNPLLSARDAEAGGYNELKNLLAQRWTAAYGGPATA